MIKALLVVCSFSNTVKANILRFKEWLVTSRQMVVSLPIKVRGLNKQKEPC